jgi:hypothetical protein
MLCRGIISETSDWFCHHLTSEPVLFYAYFYLPSAYLLFVAATSASSVLMEPTKTNGTAHNHDVCPSSAGGVTLGAAHMMNKGYEVIILIPLTPPLWHPCRLSSVYCFNTCSFPPLSLCNRSTVFSISCWGCREGVPTDKTHLPASLYKDIQNNTLTSDTYL